ncbi:17783_t:CDS:1 [Cetraspora pellucida]|uniref:17783_t:CDS:1 n=1 Tax=Cetraspora pellucida TaxID=1433469 RepID=A0ACA9MAC0_9GLOM|nr:17783_t:CDS:1 [Cetraspora pellucida]
MEAKTVTSNNNPILSEPTIPHFLKIFFMNIFTSRSVSFRKAYQTCVINFWKNSFFRTEEQNTFMNLNGTQINLDRIITHINNYRSGNKYFNSGSPGNDNYFNRLHKDWHIGDFIGVINDYCDFLVEQKSEQNNDMLMLFKINEALDNLDVKFSEDDSMIERMNKLVKATEDIQQVKRIK